MKQNSIAICIAHNQDSFDYKFIISLLAMIDEFNTWVKINRREDTISFMRQDGYCLDEMRNDVVDEAIASEHSHIVLLDTDMTFPRETLIWMLQDLEENPEAECITGMYHWKSPPYNPHIYGEWDDKEKVWGALALYPTNQIFEVGAAGAGCLMVKSEVFNKNKKPWFKFVKPNEMEEIPKGMGEDLFFFWKCKPLTLCDSRIQCQHWKARPIGIQDYIKHNGLKLEESIKGTDEQLLKIGQEAMRRPSLKRRLKKEKKP